MTPDAEYLLGYRTTCYCVLVQSPFKTGLVWTVRLLKLSYCCLQLSRQMLIYYFYCFGIDYFLIENSVWFSMRCVCFLPVLQGNGDWTVNYSSSNVCTIRGAMVDVLILSLSPLLPSFTPYSSNSLKQKHKGWGLQTLNTETKHYHNSINVSVCYSVSVL